MRTPQEALEFINGIIESHNANSKNYILPFKLSGLTDWDLQGDECDQQLTEWTNDYISEQHSEACARKDAWRYEH
jgi:hypothetical protein